MPTSLEHFLSSDAAIAILIPLTLFIISACLHRPSFAELYSLLSEIVYGKHVALPHPFSLQHAAVSFGQYAQMSNRELSKMRASYGRLIRTHKCIGTSFGYPNKLDQLENSIRTNAQITQGIADLARNQFSSLLATTLSADLRGDLGRVRESLKHFVRDWSDEGREERARIFSPILDVLKEVQPARRASMRVLVPGSGLGRLAWEISELGYHTTANELSFFMNIAFRFLLSEETTQTPHQHVLQPYSHWFSHQRTREALFRHVTFPDVVPRLASASLSSNLHIEEQDFLSLRISPDYDYISTLFFLDTSLNVIETIERIYALLRPGGMWINLGPLLWTGGGLAGVELSLEEVLRLVELVGFKLYEEHDQRHKTMRRTIECEYTADREAMMRWLYQAEFWVAVKPGC
ncbi:uncharacterized protein FIBRA_06088 [Fibroporia radiculosa]|uniref:Uncharacterized protein n=1 Tax=Fibroporia radiculosa TaxID=599839 RepID=J4IB28_9APHY|nr:uncharacterized protein FIBRA_06088 [Fibroporia radiculosa]CCM03936.1 predicted protein [Fibroporia radiculosa]